MIALTSISPGHSNFEVQQNAVDSWKEAGYRPISINHPDEIKKLTGFKGVDFVPTYRTAEHYFKKQYVIISTFIDYIKETKAKHSILINSDITIKDDLGFTPAIKKVSDDGIIIMNRLNYDYDYKNSSIYELGYDAFFINYKWIDIFPQTLLCMGQCFWDYWLPYNVIKANVKLMRLNEPYIFHKNHPLQYNANDWRRAGELFQSENDELKKLKSTELMSQYVYKEIRRQLR